jgi:N-acetylated-alpha-linked acidic dipeptidase
VPGVREALEARRWSEANQYAITTAKTLDRYRSQLDQLTALLKKAS